jgi:hypothetical protein
MPRRNGSYFGLTVNPTPSVASGIWRVREAEEFLRVNKWPATPGVPGSPVGIAGDGQVSLTWSAPALGTPPTDYQVQYSSNSGSTWTTFADGTSTATSAVVTGLTNGTGYIFRVRAVNALGEGPYGAASGVVTPDAGIPASGVAFWLDASHAPSLTVSGGSVSAWLDRSGNARHATQGVAASQPTFASASQNGRAGILFGGNDFMDVTQFLGGSAATAFVVAKQNNSPPSAESDTGPVLGNFGSHSFDSHSQWVDGNIYDGFASTTRRDITPSKSLAAARVFCWYSAASDFRLYIDGQVEFTDSSNVVGYGTTPKIGRGGQPNSTYYYAGLVFEVAVFPRALSSQEITEVTNYLAVKWGITL